MTSILFIHYHICSSIISILLLLFPIISARYSEKTKSRIISQYTEAVSLSEDTAIQDIYDSAVEYNSKLYDHKVDATTPEGLEAAGYFSQLSVNGQDMMGYLHIPKLNVISPIYHGTGEASMSRGIGHMPQSSLPIGGPNTHAVLSAHSGMAGFPGFSDLELLNPGDIFYIEVLGKTLTYEVYDIQTVLPDNIDPVQIQEDEDLCTLITCVPFGVNTHRLLVTGMRIQDTTANDTSAVSADTSTEHHAETSIWLKNYLKAIAIGAAIALGITAIVCGVLAWRKRYKN